MPYWGLGNYLLRGEGGFLRAAVTSGHPIALGYEMTVAMGLFVFLRRSIASSRTWWCVFFALTTGLIAAMSRGPWVGAAAMLVVLLVTSPRAGSRLMQVSLWSLLLVPLLLTTSQGQKILDYLPFVGTVEARNVDFRARLFDVSLSVLSNFPFFGALDYMDHPEMQQLRGGDGIIDMVNSYLGVAMHTGYVGLTLFAAPFVLVGLGIVRALYALPDKRSEFHLLGRALLASMIGAMVTIGTASSILAIPIVYWSILGMGACYLQLVKSPAVARLPSAPMPVPNWSPNNARRQQPRPQH